MISKRSRFESVPEISPKLAILIYMAILVPIVSSPFGTSLSLVLASVAAIGGMVVRSENFASALRLEPILTVLLIFAVHSALSAAWSPDPIETLSKSALVAFVATAGVLSVRSAARTSPEVATAATIGFLVIFAVLAVRATIEIVTDQAILKWYYNAFPSMRTSDLKYLRMSEHGVAFVSEIFLNRLVYIVTLFSAPAWIGTFILGPSWKRHAAQAAVASVLVLALAMSQHESSKLAIVAAAIVVATGWASFRAAVTLVSVGWVVATLFVFPIAILMGSAKLDEAMVLPASARDRVKIWRHTAEGVLRRPLFGQGAASTPALYEGELSAAVEKLDLTPAAKRERIHQHRRDRAMSDRLAPHAHNIYLQVWFELGFAGVLIFAAVGAVILRQITRVQCGPLRILALAQFALVAASSATSYGLWQPWFLSLIALSVIFMAIATRSSSFCGDEAGHDNYARHVG